MWPTSAKHRFDALLPIVFGVVMLLGLYRGTQPLLGYVEYRGAVSQLSELANRVPSDAIVLFAEGDSGERFSTPVEYLFGRTSIVVWPTAEAYGAANAEARQWLAQGTPVFWVSTPDLPGPEAVGLSGQIIARQHVALVEKLAERNVAPGPEGLFQQDLQIWQIDRAEQR
jgi:hypothetical protein